MANIPIHITGMENIKGQQTINSILDSMNNEIDSHKWIVTTQDYANLRFEKYLESGSTLTVDQKPMTNVPIVGVHNGRKVYIGDLDVLGNLNVKDLALRDNVNTVAKSWEVRSTGPDGTLVGDWWNSESFQVGVRNESTMKEVKSVPNDLKDPVYGNTISNGISYTLSGQTLDTKTFEKTEASYYIYYPRYNVIVDGQVTETRDVLDDWVALGWKEIGNVGPFPQITVKNARACWAQNQIYGVFWWQKGTSNTRIRLMSWKKYSNYEEYYEAVASYTDTQGGNGIGIMIPSWRAVNEWFDFDCKMFSDKVVTRRVISEEFDGRNSGIVKVDICYRI